MQYFSKLKIVLRLVFLIILVNVVGYVGRSCMTTDTMVWYNGLHMSVLTPPDFVFGVVWSILLLLQAFAAFLVWGRVTPRYFAMQLVLNMFWNFVFFYGRNLQGAFVVILFFILSLIMNIKSFGKISKLAGWLIVPTLLWSLFALYLNAVIAFGGD